MSGPMTHVDRPQQTWLLLGCFYVVISAYSAVAYPGCLGWGCLPGRAVRVCLLAAVIICRLAAMRQGTCWPWQLRLAASSPMIVVFDKLPDSECCTPEQTSCHPHLSDLRLHWGLQVNEGGLTSDEHAKRLEEYGPNKLPESTRNPILVYLGYMWNPLSWAMECAVILAVALLDYADFCLIIALLLTNATISYVEVGSLPAARLLPLVLSCLALCLGCVGLRWLHS